MDGIDCRFCVAMEKLPIAMRWMRNSVDQLLRDEVNVQGASLLAGTAFALATLPLTRLLPKSSAPSAFLLPIEAKRVWGSHLGWKQVTAIGSRGLSRVVGTSGQGWIKVARIRAWHDFADCLKAYRNTTCVCVVWNGGCHVVEQINYEYGWARLSCRTMRMRVAPAGSKHSLALRWQSRKAELKLPWEKGGQMGQIGQIGQIGFGGKAKPWGCILGVLCTVSTVADRRSLIVAHSHSFSDFGCTVILKIVALLVPFP